MKLRYERAAAAIALALVLAACGRRDDAPGFDTTAVARGDLVQTTTASGTLGAVVSVEVGAQVNGKVTALHVDFNSPVRRGQLLAEIDPTLYLATLAQAKGELAGAEANVLLKRANLARKQALVSAGATSRFEFDVATAEVGQAEAALQIRRAAVESAAANVAFCRITSPVDGLVISRKVDPGQTVIAALSTPQLFTIAQDITRMHITASISEADIGTVREGQQATFTVDAFPEETFRGVVSQVRKSPVMTQNVVTYQTLITVDNPDQRLFPGMTAEVAIEVARREGVLKLPGTALRYRPPEDLARVLGRVAAGPGERIVYVTDATDGLRALPVRIGISDEREVEIQDGLNDGDRVVVATLSNRAASGPGFPSGPPQTP